MRNIRDCLHRFRPVAAALAAVICIAPGLSDAQIEHDIEPAFPNLDFDRPVDLQYPADGSGRLFVVEQSGLILVFTNDPGAQNAQVFLDIQDRVNDGGNEEGLLGLAFHPRFSENGHFFVYYSARGSGTCDGGDRCSKLSRFSIDEQGGSVANPDSEVEILQVTQPFSNHNGGQIRFGPDSLLYVGLGDGGSGGDPRGNGQNRQTLLGSILRIDVDREDVGLAYAIPPDNPFVGTPFREEIFAYGFRNPWRFSFDAETDDLWTGDVGQNAVEEVDMIVPGGNYGWNIMEGNDCYSPSSGCDQSGLRLPVHTYRHGSSTGRSIIGGFVYRGARLPRLIGTYVFSDFVSGRIWGLSRRNDGVWVNRLINDTGLNVSAFGEDENLELYFLTFQGSIYRFSGDGSTGSNSEQPAASPMLITTFPNPLTVGGTVEITLPNPGSAQLQVFDALGRRVSTLLNGHLGEGKHALHISGEALRPGTYLLSLVTETGHAARKIVVI